MMPGQLPITCKCCHFYREAGEINFPSGDKKDKIYYDLTIDV